MLYKTNMNICNTLLSTGIYDYCTALPWCMEQENKQFFSLIKR